jgi:hypothetical protein
MKVKTGVIIGVLVALVIIIGAFAYLSYGYGTLVVKMTDPPDHWGPASNIYIHYSKIAVHRAEVGNESGWFTAVGSDGWIDLSTAVNVSKTIGQGSLQAGKYNLVRFQILDSIVTVEGENYTATVESGEITISITEGGIRVDAGQTAYLVIDINPKVVGSLSTGFKLVPAAKASPASE